MFEYMRKHAPTIVIFAVVAFIGTIFLVWGVGGEREKRNVAVTINGQPISIKQFMIAYENKRQLYRNVYKERFTSDMEKELKLKEKTMDDLITSYLLMEQADTEGLQVTDEEVKARIKSYPAFQQNGRFNTNAYKQLLSYNRLTPAQFEEDQRRELLIGKMTSLIKDQVNVSKTEWLEEYKRANEKIKVKYLLFNPDLYEKDVTFSDEELTNYFSLHREEYTQPEQRKIKYLLLNTKNLEPAQIQKEEIVAYYENNQEKYHQSQQVRASHLLLKVDPSASEEVKNEIKVKAEKLLARAKKGEDFAKLAKEFSEDEGSAKKGGDLGYFSRGRMVPDFEKAAFSLVRGQVSDLVETPYGYHIIKVFGVKEERTQPLEEVSRQIELLLKRERANNLGDEMAEEVYLQFSEGKVTWQELAQRAEWESKETPFFAKDDLSTSGVSDIAFNKAAFELIQKEISLPVKTRDGFALLQLADRKESYLPELAEVKVKVEQALKKEKASELAKTMAEKAAEKFKEGTALDKLAENIQIKESDFFSRQEYISDIGPARNFASELFVLEKGQLSSALPVERGKTKSYALFLLEDKQAADETKLETDGKQLREQLLAIKQEQRLQSWATDLRSKSEIEINQNLLD